MNSVDGFLILAHDKVSTNNVVIVQNFSVVAIQHTLNERIIVIKHRDGMADVISGLDNLPVVLKVQPIFALHFSKNAIHTFCMTNFWTIFVNEFKVGIPLAHFQTIFFTAPIVHTNPARDQVMIKAVF